MKYTQYFLYTRQRADRAMIQQTWIESVVNNPVAIEVQRDRRIRKWGYIDAVEKYLRVVLLEDGETVNAFFDRGFKETGHED